MLRWRSREKKNINLMHINFLFCLKDHCNTSLLALGNLLNKYLIREKTTLEQAIQPAKSCYSSAVKHNHPFAT